MELESRWEARGGGWSQTPVSVSFQIPRDSNLQQSLGTTFMPSRSPRPHPSKRTQHQTQLPVPMTSTASTDLTLGTRLLDLEIVQLNLPRHVSHVKWVYGR